MSSVEPIRFGSQKGVRDCILIKRDHKAIVLKLISSFTKYHNMSGNFHNLSTT